MFNLKSVLLSVLTVGAMAAVVGGATFAPFTSTDSATGSVTAGKVSIDVNEAGLGGTLAFTVGLDCPVGPLAPGDSCTASVHVENTSTLPTMLTLANTSVEVDGDPGTCFVVSAAPAPVALAAGADYDYTVTVTLDLAAPNSCQGDSVSVTTTATASSV